VTEPSTAEHGLRFWLAVIAGVALMGWGVYLFFGATSGLEPRLGLALTLVGLDLAHDLVVAPFVCLVGVAVARVAPPWLRGPVQAGLIASAAVLAVAWLPLRGSARVTDNPTIQPLDYVTATATVLAVVWIAAGAWAWYRWRS
jgi:hypothetical protein